MPGKSFPRKGAKTQNAALLGVFFAPLRLCARNISSCERSERFCLFFVQSQFYYFRRSTLECANARHFTHHR